MELRPRPFFAYKEVCVILSPKKHRIKKRKQVREDIKRHSFASSKGSNETLPFFFLDVKICMFRKKYVNLQSVRKQAYSHKYK